MSEVKVAELCPTLCDSMDYRVHGILQARILECVASSFLQWIFPTQGSFVDVIKMESHVIFLCLAPFFSVMII